MTRRDLYVSRWCEYLSDDLGGVWWRGFNHVVKDYAFHGIVQSCETAVLTRIDDAGWGPVAMMASLCRALATVSFSMPRKT